MEPPIPLEELARTFAEMGNEELRSKWVPILLDSLYAAGIRPGAGLPRALSEVLRAYEQIPAGFAVRETPSIPTPILERQGDPPIRSGARRALYHAAASLVPGTCSLPFRAECSTNTLHEYVRQIRRDFGAARQKGYQKKGPIQLLELSPGRYAWQWEVSAPI